MLTPISIENFRNELDESVLERGYIYFSNGWIKSLKEVVPECFEAVIEEANPHAVSFSFNTKGVVRNVFCTCGDTQHEYCRHLAAVLFHYEKLTALENEPGSWEKIEEESLKPFTQKHRK